jgi:hypothetical protein
MRYFHRAHGSPDAVLEFAGKYFAARGCTAQVGQGDHARYTGPLGHVDLNVEVEGGHYTRVDLATAAVGESDLDKRVKRFLSELHQMEEPSHQVRGAY